MRTRLLICLAVMLAGTAGTEAVAHHAFSAEYDIDKPIDLKGTLTKVKWTNPHSWVYVDVKAPDGTRSNWAIEFGAPGALRRRGFTVEDFPVGGEILVHGYLSKSGRQIVNASSVKLPDGRSLYASDSEGLPGGGRVD